MPLLVPLQITAAKYDEIARLDHLEDEAAQRRSGYIGYKHAEVER